MRLHGVRDGTGHLFAQELFTELEEAIGVCRLDGDDAVDGDDVAGVLLVRLALARGFCKLAERLAVRFGLGDGIGAGLCECYAIDGRRLCRVSFCLRGICGCSLCGIGCCCLCRIGFCLRGRCGADGVGAGHLRFGLCGFRIGGAGVAAFGTFLCHRRDRQHAPAPCERIHGRVCCTDGLGLHLHGAFTCVGNAREKLELGKRGVPLVHRLVVSVLEGNAPGAGGLVATDEDCLGKLALADFYAHVFRLCAIDDKRAVAGRFNLVAVLGTGCAVAGRAEVIAHRVGEGGGRKEGSEDRYGRENLEKVSHGRPPRR